MAWTGPHNKHSFEMRFPAGHEAQSQQKLFISQVLHENLDLNGFQFSYNSDGTIMPSPIINKYTSWHLGKAGVHLKEGCTYSYADDELDSKRHLVFAPTDPENYEWIAASNGSFPDNAVHGFNKNENQIIARMEWGGGVHPGKLIPNSKACFIGWGGKERASHQYEVLVYNG